MKYYLIAGEASGDLHGANLMKELKIHDEDASFRFFGGDRMQSVENNLAKHYREIAFMGAIDVIMNIRTIKRNLNFCKRDIIEFSPDVVILIDYPGFNIKIAEFAKKNNIRVFYYISPKIWAWKEWRIKKIKAFVDEMFTILPFEVDFYKKFDYPAFYVGNPLLDEIAFFLSKYQPGNFKTKINPENKPLIALLPGSRKQEIKMMLPVMIRLAQTFPEYKYVVSGAPGLDKEFYSKFLNDKNYPVVFEKTYELLLNSHAAIVTSGTATLETALLNVPQVVLYKMAGGTLGYKIFKRFLLKVDFVSLPNLVCGKEVVKEFVMSEMKYKLIKPEVEKLLNDEDYRKIIFKEYVRLKEIMGKPGASGQAAKKMTELLKPETRIS
ncbi:MAG: lipid-A-disaccharide synthase [Prolixibacteraceae bacterium]|nr:lipid-A-disaccharide synthase [Prolixibacteraceae bacterium]MBN2773878.1 lipid-A-disaccharide synthase [Prolixibacteraceae bacterium]